MRNTETRILGRMAGGHALATQDFRNLDRKLGKRQARGRARDITDGTETEYLNFYNGRVGAEQTVLRNGIGNYTASSATINGDARAGNVTAAVTSVDAALQIGINAGLNAVNRVCYRLMTYPAGTPIPYLAGAANPIVVGDDVYDAGFVSASENRQFLVNGVKNPAAGTRYVKMCIIGQGGVNIAGHGFTPAAGGNIGSQYTNAAEQMIANQNNAHKKWYQRNDKVESGQAEILFPRNTVFRVERISTHGNDVHVVVSVPMPQPAIGAGVLNAYNGT